jgi:hypothetical protein
MLVQLTLATLMVATIATLHLFGLALLTRALQSHWRFSQKLRIRPLTLLLMATLGIIALHTTEIWAYAAVYLELGAFSHLEEALYYSTVTYASIGYGDVLMPHKWRVFGAIEGAAGILMLGWSTAYLVSLLSQLRLVGHDWLALEKVKPPTGRKAP